MTAEKITEESSYPLMESESGNLAAVAFLLVATDPGATAQVAAGLSELSEIRWAAAVAGGQVTLLAAAVADSFAQLEVLVREKITRLPGVLLPPTILPTSACFSGGTEKAHNGWP